MISMPVAGARVRMRCPITKSPAHSLTCYWEHVMQKTCSVDGCEKQAKYFNGLCGMHWTRKWRAGEKQSTVREFGTGTLASNGYINITVNYQRSGAHVLVAEKAIGKKLPAGAIVHHMDEDKKNNKNDNLVICPSTEYHSLLHQRARSKGKRERKLQKMLGVQEIRRSKKPLHKRAGWA